MQPAWGSGARVSSGGHVLRVAAYDPLAKVVVSQAGAMDVHVNLLNQIGAAALGRLAEMTTRERQRQAVEGGEVYIQKVGQPGQLALQTDQASYDFSMTAHATVAPSWRNEATMSSLSAILEYAPARVIDLIAPKPLLLILASHDETAPPVNHPEGLCRGRGAKETGRDRGRPLRDIPWPGGCNSRRLGSRLVFTTPLT